MAWISGSLNDSFNSLKGQITKITKDVLEAAEPDDEPQTLEERFRELEAFCATQDLEIVSLREENHKISEELKSREVRRPGSVSSNSTLKNFEFTDDQLQHISELEKELSEVQNENCQLKKSLDELDLEHQIEIAQVVNVKDKLKLDFDELSKAYQQLKTDLQANDYTDKCNVIDIQIHNEEISRLKQDVSNLQTQLDIHVKEKQESYQKIKNEIVEHENIKSKLEKLVLEIKILNDDKINIDQENKKLKLENKQLVIEAKDKCASIDKLNEMITNLKLKLDEVSQLYEASQVNNSDVTATEEWNIVQKKLNILIEKIKLNLVERGLEVKEDGDQFQIIENYVANSQEAWRTTEENNQDLKSKLRQLADENELLKSNLQEKLKEWSDRENKFVAQINEAENKFQELETERNECAMQGQTDDVKRLKQEIEQLEELIQAKNQEIDNAKSLLLELSILKSLSKKTDQEVQNLGKEKDELVKEITVWKATVRNKEEQFGELVKEKMAIEEKFQFAEKHISDLEKLQCELKLKLTEVEEQNKKLKTDCSELLLRLSKAESLENDLGQVSASKAELERRVSELVKHKTVMEDEVNNLKAQIIVKESKNSELVQFLAGAKDKIEELTAVNKTLKALEDESQKWKDACIDLEVQRQGLSEKTASLEAEIQNLKVEIQIQSEKDMEKTQLEQNYVRIVEAYNRLFYDLEQTKQTKASMEIEYAKLHEEVKKLRENVSNVQEGNSEVADHSEATQTQTTVLDNTKEGECKANNLLQHRRSQSAINFDDKSEIQSLRLSLQEEQNKYRTLEKDYQEVEERETNLKKELNRFREHLVEVEEYYMSVIEENKTTMEGLQSRLYSADEQVKNSSTLYTSANVRANQQVESLSSQIRLINIERNDLQGKLSAAEDEIQKHSASLKSLQIVLEQFQQDKEREIRDASTKYDYQVQLANKRSRELEGEIESLKKQLGDAKNGLNAAARLGQQLEKKSQEVSQLEGTIREIKMNLETAQTKADEASQASASKVDKSLVKNFFLEYVKSPQGDRRTQTLRILSSVLDLSEEEKLRVGVDASSSGWLSSLLHPRGDSAQNTQSLSEAFIRFLENESRPQVKVKLYSEDRMKDKTGSSGQSKTPVLSELVLPTFASPPASGRSSILKDVLKDT